MAEKSYALPCGANSYLINIDYLGKNFYVGSKKTLACPIHKNEIYEVTDIAEDDTSGEKFPIFKKQEQLPPITHSMDFKDTNPKSKAATNRLNLALVPGSLIAFAALGGTEGDAKYGAYNYRVKGVSVQTYIAAMMRHILRFQAGEWADPDTHVPHLASILADTAIIVDGFLQENINDDRPPAQPGLLQFLKDSEKIVEHLYANFNNEENKAYTEKNKNDR